MALPEVAFWNFFSVQSTVTDFVGTRIFPNVIPQDNTTYPAIRYAFISEVHDQDLQGSAGVVRCRVQIDSYSTSFLESIQMREAIRLILEGFSGLMDTTEVLWSSLDDSQSEWEPPQDSSDVGLHRQVQDFIIRYREPIPA